MLAALLLKPWRPELEPLELQCGSPIGKQRKEADGFVPASRKVVRRWKGLQPSIEKYGLTAESIIPQHLEKGLFGRCGILTEAVGVFVRFRHDLIRLKRLEQKVHNILVCLQHFESL